MQTDVHTSRNVRSTEDAASGDHETLQHRHDSMDLEHRIGQCLKLLSTGQVIFDAGQQAVLLMLQRIHSELRVRKTRQGEPKLYPQI